MTKKTASAAVCVVALLSLVSSTGCITGVGPAIDIGMASYPIPVSPYFQDQLEDNFWEQEEGLVFPAQNALIAQQYMSRYDLTEDDLALLALKAHQNANLNELAHFYGKEKNILFP